MAETGTSHESVARTQPETRAPNQEGLKIIWTDTYINAVRPLLDKDPLFTPSGRLDVRTAIEGEVGRENCQVFTDFSEGLINFYTADRQKDAGVDGARCESAGDFAMVTNEADAANGQPAETAAGKAEPITRLFALRAAEAQAQDPDAKTKLGQAAELLEAQFDVRVKGEPHDITFAEFKTRVEAQYQTKLSSLGKDISQTARVALWWQTARELEPEYKLAWKPEPKAPAPITPEGQPQAEKASPNTVEAGKKIDENLSDQTGRRLKEHLKVYGERAGEAASRDGLIYEQLLYSQLLEISQNDSATVADAKLALKKLYLLGRGEDQAAGIEPGVDKEETKRQLRGKIADLVESQLGQEEKLTDQERELIENGSIQLEGLTAESADTIEEYGLRLESQGKNREYQLLHRLAGNEPFLKRLNGVLFGSMTPEGIGKKFKAALGRTLSETELTKFERLGVWLTSAPDKLNQSKGLLALFLLLQAPAFMGKILPREAIQPSS